VSKQTMASSRRAKRAQADRNRQRLVLAAVVGIALVVVAAIAFVVLGGDDGAGGEAFAPVEVDGTALPIYQAGGDDAAVGQAAPVLEGEAPDGTTVDVAPGEPTLVAFLAHWCPHCQAEVPVLVDLAEQGDLEGVRLVGVLTGSNPDAPNFPPAAWLEDEDWPGEVMFDDEAASAAQAYGVDGYPLLVAIDAEGDVVGRASGEVPADEIVALVDEAKAASG